MLIGQSKACLLAHKKHAYCMDVMKSSRPFSYKSKTAIESDREFDKILNTASKFRAKDFKSLKAVWYRKLRKSGFKDAENGHGELETPTVRSIAWQNQDRIRDYFLCLDEYLGNHQNIPSKDRKVLELYTQGEYLVNIAKKLKVSESWVQKTVRKYKDVILKLIESRR